VPDSRRRVYERVRIGKVKQPYCFEVNGGELFAFAGIWDRWMDSEQALGLALEHKPDAVLLDLTTQKFFEVQTARVGLGSRLFATCDCG
jgi:putative SOS response-associated peptidase YedK